VTDARARLLQILDSPEGTGDEFVAAFRELDQDSRHDFSRALGLTPLDTTTGERCKLAAALLRAEWGIQA
jgi:hypothetical protein